MSDHTFSTLASMSMLRSIRSSSVSTCPSVWLIGPLLQFDVQCHSCTSRLRMQPNGCGGDAERPPVTGRAFGSRLALDVPRVPIPRAATAGESGRGDGRLGRLALVEP